MEEDFDILRALASDSFDLLTGFFTLLWRRTTIHGHHRELAGVVIPDTVILHHSRPIHWFFTSKDGAIRMKSRRNLTTETILDSMRRPKLMSVSNCCTQFVRQDERQHDGAVVTFQGAAELPGFVSSNCHAGLLQRFVDPKGDPSAVTNSEIVSRWTPNVLYMERRLNRGRLCAPKHPVDGIVLTAEEVSQDLQARCTTSESSPNVTTAPVVSSHILQAVEAVSTRIAEHIGAVCGVVVTSLALHCKIDDEDRVVVLRCAGLRCVNLTTQQAAGVSLELQPSQRAAGERRSSPRRRQKQQRQPQSASPSSSLPPRRILYERGGPHSSANLAAERSGGAALCSSGGAGGGAAVASNDSFLSSTSGADQYDNDSVGGSSMSGAGSGAPAGGASEGVRAASVRVRRERCVLCSHAETALPVLVSSPTATATTSPPPKLRPVKSHTHVSSSPTALVRSSSTTVTSPDAVGSPRRGEPPLAMCHIQRRHLLFPLAVMEFYRTHTAASPTAHDQGAKRQQTTVPPDAVFREVEDDGWTPYDGLPAHVRLVCPYLHPCDYDVLRHDDDWLDERVPLCQACTDAIYAATAAIKVDDDGAIRRPQALFPVHAAVGTTRMLPAPRVAALSNPHNTSAKYPAARTRNGAAPGPFTTPSKHQRTPVTDLGALSPYVGDTKAKVKLPPISRTPQPVRSTVGKTGASKPLVSP